MRNMKAGEALEELRIRKARMEELSEIEAVYAYARGFMARNGNAAQWGTANPPRQTLAADIAKGNLYVICGAEQICGVFAFFLGGDPTYGYIDGAWHHAQPYGTIHRVAGNGTRKGILEKCVAFCESKAGYLRIDTHEDNHIMQHLLAKLGFSCCGTIYLENGSPRLAYDRLK